MRVIGTFISIQNPNSYGSNQDENGHDLETCTWTESYIDTPVVAMVIYDLTEAIPTFLQDNKTIFKTCV